MAISPDSCWVENFSIQLGIFECNQARLCQTMHLAVELGFLCQTSVMIKEKGGPVS